MPNDLTLARSALVDALSAALGSEITVEPWGVSGALDTEGMKRFISKAPTALVSISHVENFSSLSSGAWQAMCTFTIFILTRDQQGTPRDEHALSLVSLALPVAERLSAGTIGTLRVLPPTDLQADNLYSGAVNQIAVAIWAVSWQSTVMAQAST